MRKLLLLSITLAAIFVTESVQANENKLNDMGKYIKLANLERVTSTTDIKMNVSYEELDKVVELNQLVESPSVWNFEIENTI